jgi:transcriptional regulator with XRE-family HTH domain
LRSPTGTDLRRRLIGNFIKQNRTKAGVTQEQLAERLGYSTAQFVSNWERGISLPPLKSLPPLAEVIDVSAKAMMDLMMKYQDEVRKLEVKQLRQVFKEG